MPLTTLYTSFVTSVILYFWVCICLLFSDCKAPIFSGTEQGFQRPNSTGSVSYVSSCSHSSSSSSSGRGSVSPVGYHTGLCRVVSVSDPGTFSIPGEHDLDQENVKRNQLGNILTKYPLPSIMIFSRIRKHSFICVRILAQWTIIGFHFSVNFILFQQSVQNLWVRVLVASAGLPTVTSQWLEENMRYIP